MAGCTTTIEESAPIRQEQQQRDVRLFDKKTERALSEPLSSQNFNNKPIEIALLLPLTGSRAKIGESLKKAAEIALFDQPDSRLLLTFKDTKSSTVGTKEAFQEIQQKGITTVIGPVFADEVKTIAPLLANTSMTVFSLSNDVTLARPSLYVLGFNPLDQLKTIMTYAAQHDIKKLGIMIPKNTYGNLLVPSIAEVSLKLGLKDVELARYAPEGDDIGVALETLPIQNLDALLIVEGEKIALKIAKYLEGYKDISPDMKLLGLSAFDSVQKNVDPKLQGLMYVGVNSSDRDLFERRFMRAFNEKPQRIATLMYDAIGHVTNIVDQSAKQNRAVKEAVSGHAFEGIDGPFVLHNDGRVERSFAVLEITSAGPKLIWAPFKSS